MKNRETVIVALLAMIVAGFAADIAVGAPRATDAAWQRIAPFFSPPPKYEGDYRPYRSPLKFYDGRSVKTAEDW